MKIRKQVRALHKALCNQVRPVLSQHDCSIFCDNGGMCVLCMLIDIKKVFAAIHLAREHKLCPNWFEAERNLYELLGEKAFFNKIEIELKEVANYPRKECSNCGRIVTFFTSFKTLARSKLKRQKTASCGYCGNRVELTELPVLPLSKENNKIKEDSPPRLRRNIHHEPPVERKVTLEDLGLSLIPKPTTIQAPVIQPASIEPTIPEVPPVFQVQPVIVTSRGGDGISISSNHFTSSNHFISQFGEQLFSSVPHTFYHNGEVYRSSDDRENG